MTLTGWELIDQADREVDRRRALRGERPVPLPIAVQVNGHGTPRPTPAEYDALMRRHEAGEGFFDIAADWKSCGYETRSTMARALRRRYQGWSG